MDLRSHKTVLLYDGECRFCSAVVQFVLRHEKEHTLYFAAIESAFGATVVAHHPELQGIDSVAWFEREHGQRPAQVFVRSDAALSVAAYLGGWWRLAGATRFVPRLFRDAVYGFVSRHRHQLPGFEGRCFVPPPAVRKRFLA